MALGASFVNMSNTPIYIMSKIGMEDETYGINKLVTSMTNLVIS
jgi:hypothetical protein